MRVPECLSPPIWRLFSRLPFAVRLSPDFQFLLFLLSVKCCLFPFWSPFVPLWGFFRSHCHISGVFLDSIFLRVSLRLLPFTRCVLAGLPPLSSASSAPLLLFLLRVFVFLKSGISSSLTISNGKWEQKIKVTEQAVWWEEAAMRAKRRKKSLTVIEEQDREERGIQSWEHEMGKKRREQNYS